MRLRLTPLVSVTQATSKATAVIANAPAVQITMHNAALAATTSVNFTLTNEYIAATDTINISIGSAATAGSYVILADAVAAGSCRIHLRNITAGSLGEALVVNVSVIKNG